ncbi:MAG: type VI secretion protein [Anaerolineales bacterium]|jgi:hypothetical protein|nr:type VI secretion protein [Anaerolineales bacterium]MDX9936719.1 hypothetical protein [Anaerolineales bacterium]GER81116.1 conserved hypothetical protein [Candidatus Denitrolinea symbiosum]
MVSILSEVELSERIYQTYLFGKFYRNKFTLTGKALFFRDPYGMIVSMLQSKEMVFGFTPFNADPVVTTFDLRGLVDVIGPLKQSCDWNGEPK